MPYIKRLSLPIVISLLRDAIEQETEQKAWQYWLTTQPVPVLLKWSKIVPFKMFIEKIRSKMHGNSMNGPSSENIIKAAEDVKKRHQAAMKRGEDK